MKHILITILVLYSTAIKVDAQISINRVSPSAMIMDSIAVKAGSDKTALINKVNAGNYKIKHSGIGKLYDKPLFMLNGEYQALAFDITNRYPFAKSLKIGTDIPPACSPEVRRQVQLYDNYSALPQFSFLRFYGDALPSLLKVNNYWQLNIDAGETIRINIYLKSDASSLKNKTTITISVSNESGKIEGSSKVNCSVSTKTLPGQAFNSVIYGNDYLKTTTALINEWKKDGLTHLLAAPLPYAEFDKKGNIQGAFQENKGETSLFHAMADPWVRQSGKIAVFWQARYDKMAPVKGGSSFLQPYSDQWMKAYTDRLSLVYRDFKKINPSFDSTDLIIYVADELSSLQLKNAPSAQVKNIARLLQYLHSKCPGFKTTITLWNNAFPADVAAIIPYVDIIVPYAQFTWKLNNEPNYDPAIIIKKSLYSLYGSAIGTARVDAITSNKSIQSHAVPGYLPLMWSYFIGGSVMDMRVQALYAALLGKEGHSWWAFADTKGSSWVSNDGNGKMDYTMYYKKESSNPLYNLYVPDKSEEVIPSLRLKAAMSDLQDARLLQFLISNQQKLSASDKKAFQSIVNSLEKGMDKNREHAYPLYYLSGEEYENISQDLRKIYINTK